MASVGSYSGKAVPPAHPRSFVRLMSVSYCMPWRSVWLPRALTAVAVVVGVPLFLRSPPWCDITLYQMAARNILHGGVHYRDLFDTNLPGFVWAMTALYSVFGPSALAVRVVDLLIVLGVVLLIDRLAKWGGATLATRWWAFAGAALFYPFTVEMAHAQRDTWMALPGLAAVVLRVRRGMGGDGLNSPRSPFRASFVEGLLWGAAVWIKPHIALMALTVWLLTAWRLAAEHPRRAVALDLLGNILGGVTIGIPGVVWMVASGAWNAFLDVFLEWNPLYMKLTRQELPWRVTQELHWFPPWSLFLVVTIPLALASMLDMAPWQNRARAASRPDGAGWLGRWLPWWLWDRQAGPDTRFARGVLGGLYLVWAAQAFLIQRGFQYAHVPETLLMIGLWASHRWGWVPVVLLWFALTSALWIVADCNPGVQNQLGSLPADTRTHYLPRHRITDPDRLRLWPECWRREMTDAERYALWDQLRLHPPHEAAIGWEEIAEVAEFLRAQGVQDGDVFAWFDSPHAVYLLLDIDPGFRYMHVYTAISISVGKDTTGRTGHAMMLDELKKAIENKPARVRYVISDTEWIALSAHGNEELRVQFTGPAGNQPPTQLLPAFTPYPNEFPFNQPTIFRTRNGTGRYIVHRLVTTADGPPARP